MGNQANNYIWVSAMVVLFSANCKPPPRRYIILVPRFFQKREEAKDHKVKIDPRREIYFIGSQSSGGAVAPVCAQFSSKDIK